MAVLVNAVAPNKVGGRIAANAVTTWQVIGFTPGAPNVPTMYASIAAMISAGAVCWPGLQGGAKLYSWFARSETGSGADGSPFYFATNFVDAVPPTDDLANDLISGSGQTYTDLQFRNIWIRKTVAGDRIFLTGKY